MGQQQILLLIVGVIIVGIMLAVGITMFVDSSTAASRDEISNDLINFAASIQTYYRKPSALGGGQGTFNGLTMQRLTKSAVNANGTYTLESEPISGSPGFVTVMGVGRETGLDGVNAVKIIMNVYPDSMKIDFAAGN